jgi:L-alanine-DL-glutamate epimerase-like enolase superfamily enzyme
MRFTVAEVRLFERPVRFRLPFRFGAATVTEAAQALVRARIRLEDGREAEGGAAELLAPKWFDKSPELSEAEGLAQLRDSLGMARDAYLAAEANSAFGHSIENYGPQIAIAALRGLNNLTASFGPALLDKALLDALGRALGLSFFQMMEKNVPGVQAPGWQQDLQAFDMDDYLDGLKPRKLIAARHTVGLLDPIAADDVRHPARDGLPESLEEAIARYGHRWFKLKLGGDVKRDVERLCAIAAVLDRREAPYRVTLDGNEQFEGADAALELWRAARAEPRLKRLVAAVAYFEQPVHRQNALTGGAGSDVSELAEDVPVLIDESDDSLEAFPRARRLGYTGVSSKTCKGFYKSILNSARCRLWNREEGSNRYFMSAEDLTTQPGLAVQQDLALASLLGITHVERNGHHYVDGFAGLPEGEQERFLKAHPDLYERSLGAVRLRITEGSLLLGSLGAPGFASGALPDWDSMKEMA